jgi:hypothetical protein
MKSNFPRSLQTIVIFLVVIGLVTLALGGYFSPVTNWFSRITVDAQTWVSDRYMAVVDFPCSRTILNCRRKWPDSRRR